MKYAKIFKRVAIGVNAIVICIACLSARGQSVSMRRIISPSSPMLLAHIDSWNYPDPQKIIDLIPTDIRPYVVMNISLSISHDSTGRFKIAEYGLATAESWLRVCAQNHMWAMIQPASGGITQIPDTLSSVFEHFFKTYPNFLGFNYAEQFWGFDVAGDPTSTPWTTRIAHFTSLLSLCHQYGGYLVVSWCGNQYSPNINPIGMLKRNSSFLQACKQYNQNFVLCEKYTTKSYKFDMESLCLGEYLSGLSGNYGIRYDNSGWTDSTNNNQNFSLATGVAPYLEHIMLTGETVIDGPELIWQNCFQETSPIATSNGYTTRNWQTYSHYDNIVEDIFRKILDGTVRIPTRQEVIKRTKVVVVNNVSSGNDDSVYSSPTNLFDGLYTMDGDGDYQNNFSFFKKTGRYPTIPTVYQLNDSLANTFQVKVNKSTYSAYWPTIAKKEASLDSLFPAEYRGDIYAGRLENGWVIYNPYKTSKVAFGTIYPKYNTCDSIALSLSHFTGGVVKETASQLKIYFNNYDDQLSLGVRNDTIRIYGSTAQPSYTFTDRNSHSASTLTGSWSGGIYTLIVRHNGALDITLNCAGNATGRLTTYTNANLSAPASPADYSGARQYEAEIFNYKNITGITNSGYAGSLRNYTGQGYLQFGKNASAAIRDTVNVLKAGSYNLQTRYWLSGSSVNTIDLYVNGAKVATPVYSQTGDSTVWAVDSRNISLNAGDNVIEFIANGAAASSVYFDNIVLVGGVDPNKYTFSDDEIGTSAQTPPAGNISVGTGNTATAGVVSYTDNVNHLTSNYFRAYSGGQRNATGAMNLDLFGNSSGNYSVTWKEVIGSSNTDYKVGVLLRGNDPVGTAAAGYVQGIKQGYVFIVYNAGQTKTQFRIYKSTSATSLNTFVDNSVTSLTTAAGTPMWYRASVSGSTVVSLKLEYSTDSVTWNTGATATDSSSTFTNGSSQLIWGLAATNYDFYLDNVTSQPVIDSSRYTFTNDVAGTTAQTPPAGNISVGTGNTSTAGVVSYTDNVNHLTSNYFRAYSGGQRNATGAMNLDLFRNSSGNYSVTWKEVIGSSNTDYKVGVLLRGNDPVGTATTGYVQGMKQGYAFIVYNVAQTKTQFRIYKSTSATSLNTFVDNSVTSLTTAAGTPMWYRASVSGSTVVSLKLEYSTDSVTWNTGATATDSSSTFTNGSSQLIWGLAATNYDFYLDNITVGSSSTQGTSSSMTAQSFSAISLENAVHLNWNMATDINSKGFTVERSGADHNFSTIGFVLKNGNTNNEGYSFNDYAFFKGINYYRLKEENNDGSFTYSVIKSINVPSLASIQIYPNPMKDVLNITSEEPGRLLIFNAQGNIVSSTMIKSAIIQHIDVSNFPTGIYFYKLNTKKGSIMKK